jgi:ribosomal protein S19E (S16A)
MEATKESNTDLRQAESILSEIYRAQTSVVIPEGNHRRKYVEQLEKKGLVKRDKLGFFEITENGKEYIRRR